MSRNLPSCAPTSLDASRRRGFTLIELLIVLSIIGLLTAIMAPSVDRLVGSATAQEEWLSLERRMQKLAFRAYALGVPVEIRLKGTGIEWSNAEGADRMLFQHLFFDDQSIVINRNGLASVDRVRVMQRGRERWLSLAQWNTEKP